MKLKLGTVVQNFARHNIRAKLSDLAF